MPWVLQQLPAAQPEAYVAEIVTELCDLGSVGQAVKEGRLGLRPEPPPPSQPPSAVAVLAAAAEAALGVEASAAAAAASMAAGAGSQTALQQGAHTAMPTIELAIPAAPTSSEALAAAAAAAAAADPNSPQRVLAVVLTVKEVALAM